MKQALQLKLGQQLALTPQLQQAIKLLQMSTSDLQQIIEETLESNALLERESDAEPESPDYPQESAGDDAPEELAVDAAWEDLMPSSAPPPTFAAPDSDFTERDSAEESVQDHLRWQLNLTRLSDIDRLIALT